MRPKRFHLGNKIAIFNDFYSLIDAINDF